MLCRPQWVSYQGVKYSVQDYVTVGWQIDDLPVFGRIEYIAVVDERVLFSVSVYHTYSIDHHYQSYLIEKRAQSDCIYTWLTDLVDFYSIKAHSLRNGFLCITLRHHIERIV